jgi:membrane-bound lytic murein transglycosylase F
MILLVVVLMSPSDSFFDDLYQSAMRDVPWDWRWLKALCWCESAHDHLAVSPVGAWGIAQFMPSTWYWACQTRGITANPTEPADAIPMAAWYLQYLRGEWSWERPEWQRRELVLASYNAGLGNILRAQRKANNALTWGEIRVHLKWVTGPKNAGQTNTYVDRVTETALNFGVSDYPGGHR